MNKLKNNPSRVPAPSPIARGIAQSLGGFTLIEVLLWTGLASVAGVAIWQVAAATNTAAAVRQDQALLRDLSTAVDRSFGLLGNFEGATTARVLSDGVAPSKFVKGGVIRNAGGQAVEVSPHSVNAPNDAFAIAFPNVDEGVCVGLGPAVGGSVWDLRVNGRSVHNGTRLDVSALVAACADDPDMLFVYHSGLVGGRTAEPLVLPPGTPERYNPSTPQTPITTGVPTSVDPVAPATSLPPGAVGPGGPGGFTGGTPTGFPPATVTTPATPSIPPSVAPPPGYPPACAAPPPMVTTRSASCPAAYGAGTIQQRQSTPYTCLGEAWNTPILAAAGPWVNWSGSCAESRTVACPPPQVGSITEERSNTLSAGTWTPGAWSVTSNTCTTPPTCTPATQTATNTQWVPTTERIEACPPGFTVGDRRTPREAEQSQTGTRNFICPAAVWGPWSYGAWTPTGSLRDAGATVDTCAVGCTPASDSTTETRWVGHTPRVDNCPAGQFGTITTPSERQESRNGTRNFTCPAATWTAWSYSAWADTGGRRDSAPPSSTCANCPAPSTESANQWVPRSAACPSGQSGTNAWEAEQSRSRPVSTNCPSGTTSLPSPTPGAWGGWADTGATRNVVNTCTPTPPAGSWQEVCYGAIFNAGGGNYACSHLTGGNYGSFTGTGRGAEGLYPVTYLSSPFPACGPSTAGRHRFVYAGQWAGGNGAPGGFTYGSFEVCVP